MASCEPKTCTTCVYNDKSKKRVESMYVCYENWSCRNAVKSPDTTWYVHTVIDASLLIQCQSSIIFSGTLIVRGCDSVGQDHRMTFASTIATSATTVQVKIKLGRGSRVSEILDGGSGVPEAVRCLEGVVSPVIESVWIHRCVVSSIIL